MSTPLSVDEFLNKKRDFSPLLVHLTKADHLPEWGATLHAGDVLKEILREQRLKACNHFCLFSPSLRSSDDTALADRFKVVCFTETPIDQIEILMSRVKGRRTKPDPYGLVFKKDYIKKKGGNPVFYVTRSIASPLWSLYRSQPSDEVCRLLALVTVCENKVDFHWEREWRIVGDLVFNLDNVYCGLCPEGDIDEFEISFPSVKFISPYWGINKILDELVNK